MLNNPLERKRRAILHRSTGLRVRRSIPDLEKGWMVRFRDKKGRYVKFKAGRPQRAEYYVWKVTTEDTDAPKGKPKYRPTDYWVPARSTLLAKARSMAKEFMKSQGSEVPYDEWKLQEKGPIAYKWLHKDLLYMNDHQQMVGGNYVVFYILIVVFGQEEATFMVIRKTVMMDSRWTPERMSAERSIFDDLGRDYTMRQGHLWTSEAMSPQIVNVHYVGFLAFTLFDYVPLKERRKKRGYKRR